MLGDGHTVIGYEEDLQAAFHRGIAIDGGGEIVNEFDDELGELIGGGSLSGKKEGARREKEIGIFAEAVVEHDDAQGIEELALVFVDALHLRIKDEIGIDVNSQPGF